MQRKFGGTIDKQLNQWIDSSEGNEENYKNIKNYEEKVMNKLKGIIFEFKNHMKFEETIKKESLELEKQGIEWELELKKTEMELAYKENLEMERFQIEKLRL